MFVVGALIGTMVVAMDLRAEPKERRRRVMSDERAVGYRAALGESAPSIRRSQPSSER